METTIMPDAFYHKAGPPPRLLAMAKDLLELREIYAERSRLKTEAELRMKDMQKNLYDEMDMLGIPTFKIKEIGTFSQTTKPWTTITDLEKATFYLKQMGVYDEIMELKPRKGRLNELIKEEFIERKKPIPEDDIGIGVKVTPTISIRRG